MKNEKLLNAIGNISDELISGAMPGTEEKQRRKTGLRKWLTASLAVVLVLALGIGAGAAAGVFPPVTDLFAPLFGSEESQLELIERMGTPLDVSDTADGVTVTAEAMLSDGQNMAVLYSISREDGEPLIPADAPEDGRLLFGAEGIGGDSWRFQNRAGSALEYAPGRETARYLRHYSLKGARENRISVDLGPLEYWYYLPGDPNTQIISLADKSADWSFDLPVPENSCPVQELSGGQEEFTSNGFPLAVTSVRVSPIAVKVTYELLDEDLAGKLRENCIDGAELDDSSYDALNRAVLQDKSLILRKKDGTEIDLSAWDDGHGNIHPTTTWEYAEEADDVYGVCGTSLEEIIPLEEMDCVIFNGMEYPVNP